MARLAAADITDRLVKPIVVADSTYLDRADDELEDLAASLDVDADDIADPPHYRVKEFLKAWVGWAVCSDNMGLEPKKLVEQGLEFDPYEEKLKFYTTYLKNAKAAASSEEILKGEADERKEFSSQSIELYRG
jgi:hypothetical protein